MKASSQCNQCHAWNQSKWKEKTLCKYILSSYLPTWGNTKILRDRVDSLLKEISSYLCKFRILCVFNQLGKFYVRFSEVEKIRQRDESEVRGMFNFVG